MNIFKFLSLLSLLLLFTTGHALVDYSNFEGGNGFVPNNTSSSGNKKYTTSKSTSTIKKRSKSSGGAKGNYGVIFGGKTQAIKVKLKDGEAKATKYSTDMRFQTAYNIYVDGSFWYAESSDDALASTGHTQQGNPVVNLGFNWLKFGDASTLATVNLYGGLMYKGPSNDFASTRTDKIIGFETTKRFHQMALGLGYEFMLVGTPESEEEKSIGNIHKVTVALGWTVSSDISFQLEGATYRIERGEESNANYLGSDVSYGYISPKALLGISPSVELELGALYRTKKPKRVEDMIEARLIGMTGAYGNSIFAGLNLAL